MRKAICITGETGKQFINLWKSFDAEYVAKQLLAKYPLAECPSTSTLLAFKPEKTFSMSFVDNSKLNLSAKGNTILLMVG